jgi:hypothetical protein
MLKKILITLGIIISLAGFSYLVWYFVVECFIKPIAIFLALIVSAILMA